MDFETSIVGDKGYIKVTADLDSERGGDAFERGYKQLVGSGVKQIVIDMTEVNIINSYGIGKLLLCQQRFESDGGIVMVSQLHGFIKDVYELLYLEKRLPLEAAPPAP